MINFNDRRIAILILCGSVTCVLLIAIRVLALKSDLKEVSNMASTRDLASASQELDNASLPGNKAFEVCNASKEVVEIRNFSVAFWNASGELQTLNAFSRGWKSFSLQAGGRQSVRLNGWDGSYAMYAIDVLDNGGPRLYIGTSGDTAGQCIPIGR